MCTCWHSKVKQLVAQAAVAVNMPLMSTVAVVVLLISLSFVESASSETRAVGTYYYLTSIKESDADSSVLIDDGTASISACRLASDARICRLDAAALEVFKRLHAALDDDKDGSVDAAELDDYAREELRQVHSFERVIVDSREPESVVTSGGAKSSQTGKGSNALDLWRTWRASRTHNWTVDEVCSWLSTHASLDKLTPLARQLSIDGPHLPLLTELTAHSAVAPLASELSPNERRKLAIRATDLVLFGPPGRPHNPLKDFLIVLSLMVSLGGAWMVWVQTRVTDGQRCRVFAELASLQNAERSLGDLQDKLSRSEEQRERDRAERLRLEDAYQREIDGLKAEAGRLSSQRLNTTDTDLAEKLRLAEQEVAQLRAALNAESHRRPASAAGPISPEFWSLLQLTWESELRHCRQNWHKAELQLAKASEGLERFRRKQNSLIGVVRSAFNSAEMIGTFEMDIAKAKEFADKVKLDVSERMQRWSRIEELLGVSLQTQPVGKVSDTMHQQLHSNSAAVGGALPLSSLRHRDDKVHRRNLSHDAADSSTANQLPSGSGIFDQQPAQIAGSAGAPDAGDPSDRADASAEDRSRGILTSTLRQPELLNAARFHVPDDDNAEFSDSPADFSSADSDQCDQSAAPTGVHSNGCPAASTAASSEAAAPDPRRGSRTASMLSSAGTQPEAAGSVNKSASKSGGSKMAKLRALSVFAGRFSKKRRKTQQN